MLRGASHWRRLMLALGALSFVGGVALLTAGFFVLNGSGDDRPTAPLVDVSTQDLRLSTAALTTASPATPTPRPAPPLGDQPYNFVIEKLKVDAPVITLGLDANAVPEVPTGSDAAKVVAWYNFSAKPGTGSNAVFAGHVTWFGAAVFYNLTSIQKGDVIKLRSTDGTELRYTVDSVYDVDPADPNSLKVMQGTDKDALTIITCDGAFTDTGDPVFGGEYSSRLVVRAYLQGVSPAGAGAAAAGG